MSFCTWCLVLLLPTPLRAQAPESWFDAEQLLEDYPRWGSAYRNYRPRARVLEAIRNIEGFVEVLAFYGTWCRDSRREVPRLLRLERELGSDADFSVQLIPINRQKKRLDAGRPMEIDKSPLFIVYINGREVGRIEERARPNTEKALLEILEARKFKEQKTRYPG